MKTETNPMPVAVMQLETSEVLALLWAVEVATNENGSDVAEQAWAVHSRLQQAWQELLRTPRS